MDQNIHGGSLLEFLKDLNETKTNLSKFEAPLYFEKETQFDLELEEGSALSVIPQRPLTIFSVATLALLVMGVGIFSETFFAAVQSKRLIYPIPSFQV